MIDFMVHYLVVMLFVVHPMEEIHNCNNPNTIGSIPHLFCAWEDDDFIEYPDGKRVLRPKRKKDNFIKKYYRNKYWKDVRYRY